MEDTIRLRPSGHGQTGLAPRNRRVSLKGLHLDLPADAGSTQSCSLLGPLSSQLMDPFDLIKRGNEAEAANNHWAGSNYFSLASNRLRELADELSGQVSSGRAPESKRKIVSLYRAQSLEYMYKARHCLIEALRFENEHDRNQVVEVAKSGSGILDPLYSFLTEEEHHTRRLTFERLFCGAEKPSDERTEGDSIDDVGEKMHESPVEDENKCLSSDSCDHASDNGKAQTQQGNNLDVDGRAQSIESRLASLNSTLMPNVPPPFISGSRTSASSSEAKLEEIQRGLAGLGVTIPDSSKNSDLISDSLSPEDQVKMIIQQAKDEVHVERGGEGEITNGGDDEDSYIDENDSMFLGFENDEDDDVDALIAKAENLIAGGCPKDGGPHLTHSNEVSCIRKVQALLLEARLSLEVENKAEDTSETCQDSDKIPERKSAKQLVVDGRNCLNELIDEWEKKN